MVYYRDVFFMAPMKNLFFGISIALLVVILIVGFTNYASYGAVPFYIFTEFKQVPIMIPVFVGAFLGFLSGLALMHGLHLHMREMEEDSDFM